MDPITRRNNILAILKTADQPIAGSEFSARLSVSRQVIVQDISILRAGGEQILATPQGYLLMQTLTSTSYKKTFATCHTSEEMRQELEIMVDAGGKVIDVIVEHPVYGELRGILMLSSRRDISTFLNSINASNSKPLSALTHGVHLHTVEAASEEVFVHIERALDKADLLLKQ